MAFVTTVLYLAAICLRGITLSQLLVYAVLARSLKLALLTSADSSARAGHASGHRGKLATIEIFVDVGDVPVV
jgi:hypothetical protein